MVVVCPSKALFTFAVICMSFVVILFLSGCNILHLCSGGFVFGLVFVSFDIPFASQSFCLVCFVLWLFCVSLRWFYISLQLSVAAVQLMVYTCSSFACLCVWSLW